MSYALTLEEVTALRDVLMLAWSVSVMFGTATLVTLRWRR